MKITHKDSPHYEPRPGGIKPSFLIFHYTQTLTAQEADDIFMGKDLERNPSGRVSAHYMIDENGSITQYVDENNRAWHAGISFWDGETDINSHSIGIELVHPGHKNGYREFDDRQINALITLTHGILDRHNIPATHILGHSDISVERKIDPGELFPWQKLAGVGIGLWPEYAETDQNIETLLTAYGYDPEESLSARIEAFQRHFEPDVFTHPCVTSGVETNRTAGLLQSLINQNGSKSLKIHSQK